MAGTSLVRIGARVLSTEPLAIRLWNCVERVAAAALLLLLLPALAVVAAVIVILSRRSPIVTHARVGWLGEPFKILKFRTMWGSGAVDDVPGPVKSADDPRISSSFARFCRRHSIDELPQLVHVISGRMALVGPRPLTRSELVDYYGVDAPEMLSARPGLTGLWQVMGRSRLGYHQRRRLDLWLVRHPLVRLHAWILLRTIPQVISGRNAW